MKRLKNGLNTRLSVSPRIFPRPSILAGNIVFFTGYSLAFSNTRCLT
jgi:hypothetical protein